MPLRGTFEEGSILHSDHEVAVVGLDGGRLKEDRIVRDFLAGPIVKGATPEEIPYPPGQEKPMLVMIT